MNRSTEVEVKVGLFVAIGVGLVLLTILLLGGGQSFFDSNVMFHARFPQIEGLVEGGNVKVSGVRVGQVTEIRFLRESNQVQVSFTVSARFKNAIHQDATVGILTQGMLGDRYLVVNPGSVNSPIAAPDSELRTDLPKDLKDYLNTADEIMDRLKNSLHHMESILGSFSRDARAEKFFSSVSQLSGNLNESTKSLNTSLKHFDSILSKVDSGKGTIGAMVNDSSLYDDMKALLGGANRNRVLKYFIKKSVEDSKDRDAEKK